MISSSPKLNPISVTSFGPGLQRGVPPRVAPAVCSPPQRHDVTRGLADSDLGRRAVWEDFDETHKNRPLLSCFYFVFWVFLVIWGFWAGFYKLLVICLILWPSYQRPFRDYLEEKLCCFVMFYGFFFGLVGCVVAVPRFPLLVGVVS